MMIALTSIFNGIVRGAWSDPIVITMSGLEIIGNGPAAYALNWSTFICP